MEQTGGVERGTERRLARKLDYATHAAIDLGAIRRNVTAIRRQLPAGAKLLAPLKANAYGHGAVEIARLVERDGLADMIGVAVVPEGVELRAAGVELPILKLSHCIEARETRTALRNRMTLTVVDVPSAHLVEALAGELGVIARVHLKIDTGMRRLGAEPGDALATARAIEELPHLYLEGIFTHFPVSDIPEQDGFTARQIRQFFGLVGDIQTALGRPLDLVHCANSGAVLGHLPLLLEEGTKAGVTADHMMVRPGLIAFGCYPDATTPRSIELEPALSLHSAVSFVKPVRSGETVSYGRTWAAPRDTRVATIPVGYGDGYSRSLSNRGRVLIAGRSFPIVGRICMDQLMVDVGDADVRPGDPVTLIGSAGDETITCDEVAALMGTISYEVLCLLSPRVERLYYDGEP